MRRVILKQGMQERLPEIIGTEITSGSPDITPWSVQSAMIKNIRRTNRSIVGNDQHGRVMRGMVISKGGDSTIIISEGLGITYDGDIIEYGGQITNSTATFDDAEYFVYALHNLDIYTESESASPEDEGGKLTNILRAPQEEIVWDDYAGARGSSVGSFVSNVVTFQTSKTIPGGNIGAVYLGKFTISGGIINNSTINNTASKGFAPIETDESMRTWGIFGVEEGNSTFNHQVNFNGVVVLGGDQVHIVGSGSTFRFEATAVLEVYDGVSNVPGFTGTIPSSFTNIEVVKGIIISFT